MTRFLRNALSPLIEGSGFNHPNQLLGETRNGSETQT